MGYRSKALLSLTSDVQQIFPTMSFLWSKAPPCAPDSHVCRGAAGGRRPACASGTRAGARGKPVHMIEKKLENAPCHPYGSCGPYLIYAQKLLRKVRAEKCAIFLHFLQRKRAQLFIFFYARRKRGEPVRIAFQIWFPGKRKLSRKRSQTGKCPYRSVLLVQESATAKTFAHFDNSRPVCGKKNGESWSCKRERLWAKGSQRLAAGQNAAAALAPELWRQG